MRGHMIEKVWEVALSESEMDPQTYSVNLSDRLREPCRNLRDAQIAAAAFSLLRCINNLPIWKETLLPALCRQQREEQIIGELLQNFITEHFFI